MTDTHKRIAILGAGESGVGAAMLAQSKGFNPFVSDNGKIDPQYKATLMEHGISLEEGRHSEQFILSADEVIKSPGIPSNAPVITKLKEKNIPVISEIEFASRYTGARIIAVTGTNGKSTTTYLTYHLMKEAGLRVCMAGNVGKSFAREVIHDEYDFYVLEISSFQLDDMLSFKADISILLNITPDHLDRYHHDMGLYIISKFRILQNQGPEDKFIYFEDDPVIKAHLEKSSVIPFRVPVSLARHVNPGAYLNHESLHFLENPAMTDDTRLGLEELPLRGPHNYVNQMCAVLAARYAGVEWEQIRAPLRNFINFPHRMEKVGLINGVTWINDSKATNVDSVRYALDSYEEPIIWIAGGTDKGNDYEVLRSRVRAKVKTIVCLGKDNSRILGSFKNDVSTILDTHRVEDAVHEAFRQAKPGDVVLLSPACASFDLFKNYIDRGDRFRQAVKDLAVKNEIKN